MNKIRKVLLSVIVLLLSGFLFINVNAATKLKETTDDFTGNTYVIGSTKFDNETVVTAARAAQAGSDDAVIHFMKTGIFERIEVKIYLYNKRAETWFEIPRDEKEELKILTEKEAKELEENLEIYFVNDEEKQIEFAYSGAINERTLESAESISGLKATYKDNKFYIPATTTDVWFETTDGESIDITITYDKESAGYNLGDFYIPINVKILDEFGELIPDIYLQATADGTFDYYDHIYYYSYKEGYSLYYVDSEGKEIDFEHFVVTEPTNIKQAWHPVGRIYTDFCSYDYENDPELLLHNGLLQKLDDDYEMNVIVVAPIDYDTKNTLVNGEAVEFVNGEAVITVSVSDINEEASIVVKWEEGEEVTFRVKATENVTYAYKVSYYGVDNKVFKEEKGITSYDYISEPAEVFEKENMVFDGWTTDPETNEKYVFNQNPINDNLKLYPRFVSLKEFIEEAVDGFATLPTDLTVTEMTVLDVDKDMTLDLNGHTITSADPDVLRLKGNDASLIIRNGTFNVGGAGAAVVIGASREDTSSVTRRNLTIEESVTINSQYYGIAAFGTSQVDFYGHINLSGEGYGISGNGSKNDGGTLFNIYDGSTITAEKGAALYLPQTGITNVYGGELTAHTVVGIKAGELNIINGTFKSVATELMPPKANGNGFDFTGDIILAEENASYADHIVIDIQGGTFDNTNGGAIVREFNPSIGTDNERSVTVNGLYNARKTTDVENVFVYVNSNEAKLELKGVNYTAEDLKYVLENSSTEHQVNLINDITVTETALLNVDADMVLNLNGYTIYSADPDVIRMKGNNASLTVKNGTFEVGGYGAAVVIGASKEDTSEVTKRDLIIENDVYINSQYYGLAAFGKSDIEFYGHITLSGAGYGISGNGSKEDAGTVFNIYDGSTITASNGAALYLPQTGVTNVYGGIMDAHTVVGIKAGELNIKDGTFRALATELNAPKANGNGFDLTGDIILAEENASYADHIVIDIQGGTFDNTNGGAIVREFNPSIGTDNERSVTVRGLYATRKTTDIENVFVYVDSNLSTVQHKAIGYTADDLKYVLENSSEYDPVTLLADITVTKMTVLEADADMHFDLNGYTITSDDPDVIRMKGNNASLTVKRGTFSVGGTGAAVVIGASQEDTSNVTKRDLIIENDVYINSVYYGIAAFGKSKVDFYGHITLSGAGYGISGNGSKNDAGTVFNIYDGSTITAETGAALYLPQTGITNVMGGELTAHTVVGIKAGELNISGGKLKAIAPELIAPKANGNGFDFTGDVILVEENASYADNIKININGGSLDNSNGGAYIREFNPSIGTDNERTITVTGSYATRTAAERPNEFVYTETI